MSFLAAIPAHHVGCLEADALGNPKDGNNNRSKLYEVLSDPSETYLPHVLFSSFDFHVTLQHGNWPMNLLIRTPAGQLRYVVGNRLEKKPCLQ